MFLNSSICKGLNHISVFAVMNAKMKINFTLILRQLSGNREKKVL